MVESKFSRNVHPVPYPTALSPYRRAPWWQEPDSGGRAARRGARTLPPPAAERHGGRSLPPVGSMAHRRGLNMRLLFNF
jgi:hypothetical protein